MKYYDDFKKDAGAIIGQDLDTYKMELMALIYVYEHDEVVKLGKASIIELRNRAEKLANACTEILDDTEQEG